MMGKAKLINTGEFSFHYSIIPLFQFFNQEKS